MRIIGGKFKGIKLNSFDMDNIRPTADRAREGIFNKLQFLIKNACILDLFCGTGAISLEFLSRGAKKVISVDNNKNSINLINQNFDKVKEKPNLIYGDYLDVLSQLKNQKFDIIFLDPPFSSDYGIKAILKIINLELLEKNGIIVFEHSSTMNFEKEIDKISNKILILDTKKYGSITVEYIKGVEL